RSRARLVRRVEKALREQGAGSGRQPRATGLGLCWRRKQSSRLEAGSSWLMKKEGVLQSAVFGVHMSEAEDEMPQVDPIERPVHEAIKTSQFRGGGAHDEVVRGFVHQMHQLPCVVDDG